jgi:hypothetical protein
MELQINGAQLELYQITKDLKGNEPNHIQAAKIKVLQDKILNLQDKRGELRISVTGTDGKQVEAEVPSQMDEFARAFGIDNPGEAPFVEVVKLLDKAAGSKAVREQTVDNMAKNKVFSDDQRKDVKQIMDSLALQHTIKGVEGKALKFGGIFSALILLLAYRATKEKQGQAG